MDSRAPAGAGRVTARRTRVQSSVPLSMPPAPPPPPPPRASARAIAITLTALAAVAALALRAPGAPPASPSPSPTASASPAREASPEPSLADKVRMLAHDARVAKLDFDWTDRVWQKMRPSIPRWNTTLGTLPHLARKAIAQKPEIAQPLASAVAPLLAGRLARTFTELRPHVAGLLASPDTPEDQRRELLTALTKLDLIDCFHEYVGRAPPFGVQAAMRGAFELDVASERDRPPPSARPLWSARNGHRLALFRELDDPSRTGLPFDVVSNDPTLKDSDTASVLKFKDVVPAGRGGKRIRLLLGSFTRETYCLLTPPEFKVPLPVRLPRDSDFLRPAWVSVTLRGALAERTGEWVMKNDRFYRDGARLAFALGAVCAEPLP